MYTFVSFGSSIVQKSTKDPQDKARTGKLWLDYFKKRRKFLKAPVYVKNLLINLIVNNFSF